jgi:cis-L-3-hydroxyproline dehydratase
VDHLKILLCGLTLRNLAIVACKAYVISWCMHQRPINDEIDPGSHLSMNLTTDSEAELKANVSFTATLLVGREAQGKLIFSTIPLSFWGGVDPAYGRIIDKHHPLNGVEISNHILAIPGARGSCTGSSVMLELLLNGHAPAGLIIAEQDEILALGVVIAEIMFGVSIPVARVDPADFAKIESAAFARIIGDGVQLFDDCPSDGWEPSSVVTNSFDEDLEYSPLDEEMLSGLHGEAAAVAMAIIVRMASLQHAPRLIDVHRAHIDGCIYTGDASIRFAQRLVALGGKVRIPTTLNAISVDRRRWRVLGVEPAFGHAAEALVQAYLDMGAQSTFTCAPYLLDDAPQFGEQIVWAESNAVVFANSVLGARTQKYADFLDICIALTGRAPLAGCHLDEGRIATICIDVGLPSDRDDAWWPLLGYHVGMLSGSDIPVIRGLESASPSIDDYKAFGAAFATTSGAAMFHIAGCTPEAPSADVATGSKVPRRSLHVSREDLIAAWHELDSADSHEIQLVSLGNPHLSITECARIADLCEGYTRHPNVRLVLTLGRFVEVRARAAGYLEKIEAFGATIITDTCWCMLGEPIIPQDCRTLLTNSGKFAHYAPGLLDRQVQFACLEDCIIAARSGCRTPRHPDWLQS